MIKTKKQIIKDSFNGREHFLKFCNMFLVCFVIFIFYMIEIFFFLDNYVRNFTILVHFIWRKC